MLSNFDIIRPTAAAPLAAIQEAARSSAELVGSIASAGIIILGLSILLCLVRIVRGPTLGDRGTAVDVIGVQLMGIIILLTIRTGSLLFVDGILIVALLAFAGTVAVAQFIARPFMIEGPENGQRSPEPDLPSRSGEHLDADDPTPDGDAQRRTT